MSLFAQRAMDPDNEPDSVSSEWTDSESEDDDVIDGLSTLRLSRSARPSPAKKERKIVNEIDDILFKIDAVKEAATVGIPDDYLGEKIISFIVTKENKELDESYIKTLLFTLNLFAA